MKKFIRVIMCLSLLTISGCVRLSKNKTICTTTYPISYIVDRLGDKVIRSKNISSEQAIQVASIAKDYNQCLDDGDALIYISGLEPYFQIFNSELRNSKVDFIDLLSYGYFNDFRRYTVREINGFAVVVDDVYYEGEVFQNVNTYKKDLFMWMDPLAMLSSAELIRDYMIRSYPEYANEIMNNYEQLAIDLTNLDATYQTLKTEYQEIAFVSMTPSFGNWQKTYGINVYPATLSRYGALPSEQQLEIIKQRIKNDGVKYIAHEQNLNPELEALFVELRDELDLIPFELSNISSLSDAEKEKNKDYLTIMYDNFKVLESIGE